MANKNAQKLEMLRILVGESLFKQITNIFGGDVLYIPSDDADKAMRNAEIRQKFYNNEGLTYKDLALEYGLSESHVRSLFRKR